MLSSDTQLKLAFLLQSLAEGERQVILPPKKSFSFFGWKAARESQGKLVERRRFPTSGYFPGARRKGRGFGDPRLPFELHGEKRIRNQHRGHLPPGLQIRPVQEKPTQLPGVFNIFAK